MRARQSDLFAKDRRHGPNRRRHGGGFARGRAKLERPLNCKLPVHVILRASKAKGSLSLRATSERKARIAATLSNQGKRFGVRVLSLANVGNHLHLIVRFHSRPAFQRWLRSTTGLIARLVTGARRGQPFGKFWDELAFSRVIAPGRDVDGMLRYLEANRIEAWFGREARELFLAEQADRRSRARGRISE